jgi:hypothetical protein
MAEDVRNDEILEEAQIEEQGDSEEGINVTDLFSEYLGVDAKEDRPTTKKKTSPQKKTYSREEVESMFKSQEEKFASVLEQVKGQVDKNSKVAEQARMQQFAEKYEKDWQKELGKDIWKEPEMQEIYNLTPEKAYELRVLSNKYAQPVEAGGLGQVFYPDQMVKLDSWDAIAKELVTLKRKMNNYKGIYSATKTQNKEEDIIGAKLRNGEISEEDAVAMELDELMMRR